MTSISHRSSPTWKTHRSPPSHQSLLKRRKTSAATGRHEIVQYKSAFLRQASVIHSDLPAVEVSLHTLMSSQTTKLIKLSFLHRSSRLRAASQLSGLPNGKWTRHHARLRSINFVDSRHHGTTGRASARSRVTRLNSRTALHRRSQHCDDSSLSCDSQSLLSHPNTQVDHQVTAEHHHEVQRRVDGSIS